MERPSPYLDPPLVMMIYDSTAVLISYYIVVKFLLRQFDVEKKTKKNPPKNVLTQQSQELPLTGNT